MAFDAGGLTDDVRVPGFSHAGRLRELRGGNGAAVAAGLALDYAVDAFGATEAGDAETRDGSVGAEAVDLLVGGHEGEDVVDALFSGEGGVFEWVGGLLGWEFCGEG